MKPDPFYKNDQELLSFCTKYLAHGGQVVGGTRRPMTEPWRFPLIQSADVSDSDNPAGWNEVTFIYLRRNSEAWKEVSVIGTFRCLYDPVALRPVQFMGKETKYLSVSFLIPKRQFHTYRFLVGDTPQNDLINPQTRRLDNGSNWSCFFTEEYASPSVLREAEIRLLSRLIAEITPLRTVEAENFLKRFYNVLDEARKASQFPHVYRLDDSVGEVNFIDNLLARGERHRLGMYRAGLRKIDDILRKRHPDMEPAMLPKRAFEQLFQQMQEDAVPGWNERTAPSPKQFLNVVRRHVVMGAFSHPRHGGNSGAAGWEYLSGRFPSEDASGTSFDWPVATEKPLGKSEVYFG